MSKKVIQFPKRKNKSKIPFSLLKEQVEEKKEIPLPQEDDPNVVRDRGYSLLQINIRIVGSRAIDMNNDVSLLLDGKPLMGLGRIELSKYPPHFGLTIVDEKQFQDSINKAGFFYAHGFTLSKLLIGRNYPALKCAECADNNREGWLRLELGGYCSNKDCKYAAKEVKAKAIQEELRREDDTNSKK